MSNYNQQGQVTNNTLIYVRDMAASSRGMASNRDMTSLSRAMEASSRAMVSLSKVMDNKLMATKL